MAKDIEKKMTPSEVAHATSDSIIRILSAHKLYDGIAVQVRVSSIKRDAEDITKPVMHEVLATVDTQFMEPSA